MCKDLSVKAKARQMINEITDAYEPLRKYLDENKIPAGVVSLTPYNSYPYILDIKDDVLESHLEQQEQKRDPDYWKKELEKCQGSPYYYFTNYLKFMGKMGQHVAVSEEVFDREFKNFINHGLQKAMASVETGRIENKVPEYKGGIMAIIGPQGSGKTSRFKQMIQSCGDIYHIVHSGSDITQLTRTCNDFYRAPTNATFCCDGITIENFLMILLSFPDLKNAVVTINCDRKDAERIPIVTGRNIGIIECKVNNVP